MDERTDRRLRMLLALALGSIVIGGTIDLLLDQPQRWLSFHTIFETLMIAGALIMATTLWLGWFNAERTARQLRDSLEQGRVERDRWRENARHALAGFGHAIYQQFDEWQLTPTEREVALLLLKGHSHKTIARLTDRSPATIRQHATSVYQKAGLGGRAQLAAFFLEDLVLPDPMAAGPGSAADQEARRASP